MLVTKERGVFYRNPLFADFPQEEFEERVEAVRTQMSEKMIDALVLWDEDNIRYFSGYACEHWKIKSFQVGVMVIPLDRDPIMICPEFFRGNAEGTTYIKDIRGYDSPHHHSANRDLPRLVAGVVKELGHGKGRIGIEDGQLGHMWIPRPPSDIDLLRSELGEGTIVPAADVIWQCRMVKSDLEIQAIRTACALMTEAFSEFAENFSLGMSEREAGILYHTALVKRGLVDAFMYFTGNPTRNAMPDTWPAYDGVPMNRGGQLTTEVFAKYKGYWGGVGRCLSIGEIAEAKWELIEATEYAQDAALASIREGIEASDVLKAMQEAFAEKGFARSFAGHGMGLSYQEPPTLNDEDHTPLEKGMVLAVEIWIFDQQGYTRGGRIDQPPGEGHTNQGVIGMEEYVVVTDDGCEMLPTFPREIRTIPR